MKFKVFEKAAIGFSKLKFKAIDKEPELWFIAGTVLIIGAIHESGKSRVKYEKIKEEFKEELETQAAIEQAFDENKDEEGLVNGQSFTKADRRNVRIRTTGKFVKDTSVAYLKTVGLAAAGLICFGKSFGVLKTRYAGLAAAYATMAKRNGFLEEQLNKLGGKLSEYEASEPVAEGKENAETPVSKEVANEWTPNAYDRIFDVCNLNFEKSAERNKFFLINALHRAQHMLETRGYLFLNEVYDLLGFEPTQTGALVGWKYYKDPEEMIAHGATNEVSFGLGLDNWATRRFINGWEESVLLQFNVEPEPIIDRCGFAVR